MLLKLKKVAVVVAVALCACVNAHAVYNLEYDEISPLSSFKLASGGSSEDGSTFTVANPDASVPAFLILKPFTRALAKDEIVVSFEYKASSPDGRRVLASMISVNYFRGTSSGTSEIMHQNVYSTADADGEMWNRCMLDISKERLTGFLKFGRVGHVMWLHFVGLPAGTNITLRNLKIVDREHAEHPVTVAAKGASFVSPELFNFGVRNGYGHHSRQYVDEAPVKYMNPAEPGLFPILAWNGVEPHVSSSGSIDWERFEADFRDFWSCGFSLTLPTGNPTANAHCIWDNIGRFIFKDTKLRMFLKPADLRDEEIQYYAQAPRLAGWFIRDEPFVFQFAELRALVDRVSALDKDHVLYGNVFGSQGDMSATGAADYEDYIDKYLSQVGIGYLSYDFYPIRQYEATGERYVHPMFFYNLETASRMSAARGIPFWGFVHSVESNCLDEGVKYPKPSLEEMKIEAFCALAYGAQGIQYFTYGCPYDPEYNYQNSPLDADGNKTPTWDMVKTVNTEINALTSVFLGARLRWAAHTAENTPEGCRSLTADMLPDGIGPIASAGGDGLCVTMLSNGATDYLMIVNPDINHTQTVRVGNAVTLRQVTPQGITTPQSDDFVLAPGEYAIYIVGEGAPSVPDASEPWINPDRRLTDSRSACGEVDIRKDASGHVYINNMGTENWERFTLAGESFSGLTVTPRQAADNWGAWFNYTIDVEADGDYDISIRHAVPWDSFRRIASSNMPLNSAGALCADYRLDYDASVCWPSSFASAMVMEIDGTPVVPSNQTAYPSAPEAGDVSGERYNTAVADKSSWIPADRTLAQPLNAALHFWPRGGVNDAVCRVNDQPDYAGVRLAAGRHVITVRSLCSPWKFYGIDIVPSESSAIDEIGCDTDSDVREEWFDMHGRRVNPASAAPGLYLRRRGATVDKIVL